MRVGIAASVALTAAATVVLTGCSSSSKSSTSPTTAAAATTSVSSTTTSVSPTTSAVSSAATGSPIGFTDSAASGGATFSGAFSGTMTARFCTGAVASLKVVVDGDSEVYNGTVSATTFGFVGPAAADYTLAEGDAKPVVSSDGTSFTVTGEKLIDLISQKSITLTGVVTCP